MDDLVNEFVDLRVWAVVGASTNPNKYGNIIFRNLLRAGYQVYAVNPRRGEIDGCLFYPSLAALPEKPDVVDIVVLPKVTEQVVQECARLDIERVWMQPGAESAEAIRLAEELGLKVVHHACAMIHRKVW